MITKRAMLTRFLAAGAFIWNQGSFLRPSLKSSLEGSLCKPLQGCSKWWAPGCVKLGKKLHFVYLVQAGEHNFFTSFSHILRSTF